MKKLKQLIFPSKPTAAQMVAAEIERAQDDLRHHQELMEQHTQAAEHHEALTAMYQKRIARLSKSEAA